MSEITGDELARQRDGVDVWIVSDEGRQVVAHVLRRRGLDHPADELVGDLGFVVRAAAREGTVGLRIVGDQLAIHDPECATFGSIEVGFDAPPASITESTTPAGRQLHVAWPDDQSEVRITSPTGHEPGRVEPPPRCASTSTHSLTTTRTPGSHPTRNTSASRSSVEYQGLVYESRSPGEGPPAINRHLRCRADVNGNIIGPSRDREAQWLQW